MMGNAAAIPRVSVILPCYNVAPYISDSLGSVFAQTFRDYEVIVVNDGSPDTEEFERIIAPYRDRLIYIKKENGGVSSAQNAGLRVARGEFVAVLGPDDMWLPRFLERQLELLDADPSIDMIYSDAEIFGAPLFKGETCMHLNRSEGEVTFEKLLRVECSVITIASVVRRAAIERAGGFDEELRTAEDYDLWLRILKNGGRIVYHREVLAKYRRRGDSLTADPVRAYVQNVRLLEKLPAKVSLTAAERELVAQRLVDIQANVDLHEGRRALFSGDVANAIVHLEDANRYFRKAKITATVWMLRFAPQLVLRIFDLRDHYLYRRRTRPA